MDFKKLEDLFSKMSFNYEERKVENTHINKAIIDTSMVPDSSHPYETGISHPNYNKGHWIIVELYETKELALVGHKKWVKLFSLKKLPSYLVDADRSIINDMAETFTGQNLN